MITPSEPVVINPDASSQGAGDLATYTSCTIRILLLKKNGRYYVFLLHSIHTCSSGLFLSIPISDQGNPLNQTQSLSQKANCDAAVQNLAVYSINSENDVASEAAATCIGEIIYDSSTPLCSCKFLIPHFSAFAVVDTSPSQSSPISPSSTPATPAASVGNCESLSVATLVLAIVTFLQVGL
jgi:hypothetical protein